LLNSAHIQSYLQDIANAISNIKQWCSQIKENSSFSLENAELSKKHKIRLYNFPISAGTGNDIDDNVQYAEYYTDEFDCDFALKIDGDSMEPEIPDKSIVLVKKCENIENGKVGAFYYDGEIYCKRLIENQGVFYLESNNAKYEPIKILPDSTLKVYGKVIKIETT